MIALDTNILVRIVTKDDAVQVDLARRLLRQCRERQTRCVVTIAVLCELQWVLTRTFKASSEELAAVIEMLLNDDLFAVEEALLVRCALDRFRAGRADFSDYLIGERGISLDARTTFTFDRALGSEDHFTLLEVSALEPAKS